MYFCEFALNEKHELNANHVNLVSDTDLPTSGLHSDNVALLFIWFVKSYCALTLRIHEKKKAMTLGTSNFLDLILGKYDII